MLGPIETLMSISYAKKNQTSGEENALNYPVGKNGHFLGTLLLAVAFLVSAVPASGGARALHDSAVNDAVEDELAKDKRIVLQEIDVPTESGIVKLSGTVISWSRSGQRCGEAGGLKRPIRR
jgi:hypothetical protein